MIDNVILNLTLFYTLSITFKFQPKSPKMLDAIIGPGTTYTAIYGKWYDRDRLL